VDIGKSISFTFEDEDWPTKIVIGAAFLLIPIVGSIAAFGYMLRLMESVIRGEERPLPAWDDLGDMLAKGALLFVAQLVYAIPLLIMICAPLVLVIPLVMPLALAGESEELQAALGGTSAIAICGVSCLAFLYWLFLLLIGPAIMIQLVRTRQLGACFRVGELFNYITSRTGDYLTAVAVAIGISLGGSAVIMTMSSILGIIPCIGTIIGIIISLPVYFLIFVMIGHLYGQLARLYQ
jgi:hypothetical protein